MRKLLITNQGSEAEDFEFEGQAVRLAPGEAVELGEAPSKGQVVMEVAAEPAGMAEQAAGVEGAAMKGGFL